MGSYFRDFYAPKATQQPTIGDTKFSVIRQDHMGWLNCDGRLLSTADYELLFRVVGYSFGGSGGQFALPDMRSRVPGAINQGVGLTNRALGDAVGTETHTLIINEMPSHTHGSSDVSGNANGNGFTTINGLHDHGGQTGQTGSAPESETTATGIYTGPVVAGSGTHSHTIADDGDHQHRIYNTGGGAPHNNMQPTLFIGNAFIYGGKIHGATSKWRYEIDTNIL